MIFQELCYNKIEWDTEISNDYKLKWTKYLNELKSLDKIVVNRHVLCCDNKVVDIHGFCDASEKAYCAVVYTSVVCEHGTSIKLWAGKSRIAPLKGLSIPRLELLACLLLSKLVNSVVNAVKVEVDVNNIYCWTDSRIALWGVRQNAKVWNVWVQNRVVEVRSNVLSDRWFYVPTDLNPADIGTRWKGLVKLDYFLWFNGPRYLKRNTDEWPSQGILDGG